MDVRWIPVLAATLGVLGGVGGAFVGGRVANEGQEKGFTRERAAELQDLRIDAYGTFLATAEEVAQNYVEHAPEERSPADNAAIDAALVRLLVAKARVALVAQGPLDSEVNRRAYAVTQKLTAAREAASDSEVLNDYVDEANRFLVAARADIETSK